MKHPINPLVDCPFKRVLGTEQNRNLLTHFLNAILRPEHPIESVTLIDSFNGQGRAEDKLSVVDVKARDRRGGWRPSSARTSTPSGPTKRNAASSSSALRSSLLAWIQ